MIFDQVIRHNGPQNVNYSIYGHTFLGMNPAIYRPIGRKCFMVTAQETSIYRFVMRNHDFDDFYNNLHVLREMGVDAKVSVASRPDQPLSQRPV